MEPYKRADGRSPYWHVDLAEPGTGRRLRLSTGQTERRSAVRWIAAKVQELEDLARRRLEGDETTLADALRDYLLKVQAAGQDSASMDRRARKIIGKGGTYVGRFHLDGNMLLSTVTKAHVEAIKRHRTAEGNSPGTIATELRVLRAASMYAKECGKRPAKVDKWGIPTTPPKLRYLSPEEFTGLLDYLNPERPIKSGRGGCTVLVPQGRLYEDRQDAYDLAVALCLTGGRWNEVAALTRGQVNLARGTITLWGWKGQKERTVPLVGAALEVFTRRLAAGGPGLLIFPGRDGKRRSEPSRAIKRGMDAAGLNAAEIVAQFGRATTHSLRHTYASWLRQNGVALDEVQPLLGHADIETTMVYAAIRPSQTFDAARAGLTAAAPIIQTAFSRADAPKRPTASARLREARAAGEDV